MIGRILEIIRVVRLEIDGGPQCPELERGYRLACDCIKAAILAMEGDEDGE